MHHNLYPLFGFFFSCFIHGYPYVIKDPKEDDDETRKQELMIRDKKEDKGGENQEGRQ